MFVPAGVSVATHDPLPVVSVAEHSVVDPTEKVTVPVGVAVATFETVAEYVTGWP